MDIEQALEHTRSHATGVLCTIGQDGTPHLGVVLAAVVDGALWISSTQDRVKVKNIRRSPRASFSSGLGPWVTIEGSARIHDGDDVLERLWKYYRTARGEHPDWEDYDRAMIRDKRLIIEIIPERAYGFIP